MSLSAVLVNVEVLADGGDDDDDGTLDADIMHRFETDDPPRVRNIIDFMNGDCRLKLVPNPRVKDNEDDERAINSIIMATVVTASLTELPQGLIVDLLN